jgi:hypothetical protein
MPKTKPDKKTSQKITATYRVSRTVKASMDRIEAQFGDDYKRLRGTIIDLGIEIVVALINKNGVEWLLQNREALPTEISDNL